MDKYEFAAAIDGVIDALSRFKSPDMSVDECEEKLAKLEREDYRRKCVVCRDGIPYKFGFAAGGEMKYCEVRYCPSCGAYLNKGGQAND